MQQMAQGLASLGRGQDSMLVHMTPGEVYGLQSLAQQHGGSLTINPHTGLPEAGFLSSILPMAAAAAAIYFTGGAAAGAEGFMGLSAAQTGMLAGAATGALTNQQNPLMGGLMGGLSGYGMGGMMGSLAGAAPTAPVGNWEAGMPYGTAAAPLPSVASAATNSAFGVPTAGGVTAGGVSEFGGNVLNPAANPFVLQAPIAAPAPMTDLATGFGGDVAPLATAPVAPVAAPAPTPGYTTSGIDALTQAPVPPPPQSYMDKVSSGFTKTMSNPMPFLKDNYGKIAMAAAPLGMAAVKAMSAQPTLPANMASTATPNQFYNAQYSPGTRNPNFGKPGEPYFLNQGYQQGAFSKAYTAYAAAGGSMQDIQANSRPILPPNQMIGGSAPNENQFYPGANIAQGGASGAPQAPAATDVVGGYDQKLDQYTGEPVRMAEGGTTDIGSIPLGGAMPSGFLSGIQSLVQQNPSMIRQLGGNAQSSPNDYIYDPETQQFVKKSDLPPVQGMKKGGKTIDTEINTDEPSERDIYENTDDDTIAKLQKVLGKSIAEKSMAGGGIASLNEYAAGGKLLQGPGDGMSDSIPAVIKGDKPQRAALAQGEFVLPADVVSHLGNGSTDAGSKRLYAMMDKIRHARTGSKKQGRQINPDQFMPA